MFNHPCDGHRSQRPHHSERQRHRGDQTKCDENAYTKANDPWAAVEDAMRRYDIDPDAVDPWNSFTD